MSARKKVDNRLRTLIENGVRVTRHRSLLVIVGDRAREQVPNVHYVLSKCAVRTRPSVLWCYKKDLGFSSSKKKRGRQNAREVQRGVRDADDDDPFELFLSSTDIRYTFYRDTQRILGQTFGMCVLQDFEALTPNLLARTIETVEGGGLIVLMLRSLSSLEQLYSLTLDVHSRFRTEGSGQIVPRFNERFLLSLGTLANCLVVDDELNVLPISSHIRTLEAKAPDDADTDAQRRESAELRELKESLRDTEPIGTLIQLAKTLDQAKVLLTFVETISEKTLRSTVSMQAGRGRGKSAALGVSIAAAIALGYSNIFVTSPTPENLKTVFEFVFKGFDALGYTEHIHYSIMQSVNPDFNKAVVRVNVFRDHRQTIQYIQPDNHAALAQAELLVVDEAAAIPLPVVRKLLGPYLVFLSSTINGYEGTGRSLSLKLISQLRHQQSSRGSGAAGEGSRSLREVVLEEPIRYAAGDPVESWLNKLLCLDASVIPKSIARPSCPSPDACELHWVNRDTLFSFHPGAETFLQRLVGLFVASHYKNSPDDLLLMADAPQHHLFVLLAPVDDTAETTTLPEVLCAVQVALEGHISKASAQQGLQRGMSASGDLIPWTVSQQFQDTAFPQLSGARIVRVATHPDYQRLGYGRRAMDLLARYYAGDITPDSIPPSVAQADSRAAVSGSLLTDAPKPRTGLPPLLSKLSERPAERLQYLGVSFGLTRELLGFWHKLNFSTVYVRQTANSLTGEHTAIVLSPLAGQEEWLPLFARDFHRRFMSLLAGAFRDMPIPLVLSVLSEAPAMRSEKLLHALDADPAQPLRDEDSVAHVLSPHDIRRLESYSRQLVDFHAILDLVPTLARLFFLQQLPLETTLSAGQKAIICGVGLQAHDIDHVAEYLTLPSGQVLALFNKAIRKLHTVIRRLREQDVGRSLPSSAAAARAALSMQPGGKTLDEDIAEAEEEYKKEEAERQSRNDRVARKARELRKGLSEFEIDDDMASQIDAAARAVGVGADGSAAVPTTISVKRSRSGESPSGKAGKDRHKSKKEKKKRRAEKSSAGEKRSKKKRRKESKA
jgi:N-acetyltransferase 10